MTRHSLARGAAFAFAAAFVFAAPLTIASTFADGLAAAPAGSSSSSFGERWIAGRLRLGARFTYDWLEDSRRSGEDGYDNGNLAGNFLGTLWGLDAKQHYFPNPYLEYRVISGVGVGVAYDELRARTLDWANDEHEAISGDGDLDIRGIGVYAVGRYRNRSRFEPYGSLGYSWYHFALPRLARLGRAGAALRRRGHPGLVRDRRLPGEPERAPRNRCHVPSRPPRRRGGARVPRDRQPLSSGRVPDAQRFPGDRPDVWFLVPAARRT